MFTELISRIEKSSEVLVIKNISKDSLKKKLNKVMEELGIDNSELGINILEAETTEFDDFKSAFINGDHVELHGTALAITPDTIPIARLKVAWEMLKGNDPFKKKEEKSEFKLLDDKMKLSMIPTGQWDDLTLLERYNKDCPQDITDELYKRSRGRNIIVFEEDGNIDEEHSLYMIRKAKRHETPATYKIKGEIKKVYKVGEFPMEVMYECPVHSHVLLIDGYCEECAYDWDVTRTEYNAFIRLVSENTNESPRTYKKLKFDELKNEFPKIYLKFIELKEEDKLPRFKRKLSGSKSGDPFRVVHKNF